MNWMASLFADNNFITKIKVENARFYLPFIGWKNVDSFKSYMSSKMIVKYAKYFENEK